MSALLALRVARASGMPLALADIVPAPAVVHLPGRALTAEVTPVDEPPISATSLEEAGFPFQSVEANQGVDLWKLGDVPPFSQDNPLELCVFDSHKIPRRKKSRGRLLRRDLPENAIVPIDPTLAFVCPELIAVHIARYLDALELAQVIMEFCGTYSLDPRSASAAEGPGCAYELPPVTTLARIRWYVNHSHMYGGAGTIRQALDMAMEGAGSPAEANLALALSLPAGQGGYGFEKPQLNPRVDVSEEDAAAVGGEHYYLDVFWQDAYADLEFESTSFHLDPLAAERLVAIRDGQDGDPEATRAFRNYVRKADADRRRMRELQYLGLQVIPVISFDLRSVRRMDQVALALARRSEEMTGRDLSAWRDGLGERDYRKARRELLQRLQPHTVVLP